MRPRLLALLAALTLAAGCGGSAVDRAGAPRNLEAASVVPADAALYVGVVTDTDSTAWRRVGALLDRFPDGDRLLGEIARGLSGKGLDWDDDVRPALGPVTAIVLPRGGGEPVGLTKPSLRAKLDALLGASDDRIVTTSLEDGWVAVARKQATLDAYEHALDGPRLVDDGEFADAVDGLPEDALATVFVRPRALNLAGLAGAAGTAVPPTLTGGLEWLGASLAAQDDGLAFDGTARMDDAPASYEPALLRRVPAGVVLAVSFRGDERAFRSLTGNEQLQPFLGGFQSALGVRLEELLALLRGEGVLYVRPGLPVPEVTLAVETDDAAAATATIDRVARKLGGEVRVTRADGVEAHAVRVAGVQVTWAVADGVLVVSTGAGALRDFRSEGAKLVDDAAFGRAAAKIGLGDETAGLAYVDVRRVTELIDGFAGLAGDGPPPELSRNLEPVESLAVNATAERDGVRFSGFLSVPGR